MNKEDILKVKQLSIMNDGKSFYVFGVPLTELCDEALKGNITEQILEESGVCPNCGDVPIMDGDGPFSHCQCGTGEDYGNRPAQAIQLRLMRNMHKMECEIDSLKNQNELLKEKLRWVVDKWVDDTDPQECYPEFDKVLEVLDCKDEAIVDKLLNELYGDKEYK